MSKMQAEGVVRGTYVNQAKNPGGHDTYAFTIDSMKGSFRCGTRNPLLAQGDKISFVYEVGSWNGKEQLNVDVASIQKTATNQPIAAPAPKPFSGGFRRGGGRDSSFAASRSEMDLKNRMTAWHSARSTAVEILAAKGALDDLDSVFALAHKLYDQTLDFLTPEKPVEAVTAAPVTNNTAPSVAPVAAVPPTATPVETASAVRKFNF